MRASSRRRSLLGAGRQRRSPASVLGRIIAAVRTRDGRAERDHRAVRQHLRGLDARRASRPLGILTIVVFAITMARTAPARMPARLRVPSYAVWEAMVFVLNVLAFMLIGLQMRPIWTRLDAERALGILRGRCLDPASR